MLTVAIPTYNRSKHIDRQLRWLAEALRGCEDRVQVLISDNASPDDTQQVVESWMPAFERADFTYRRHATNIGAIANMASCIRSASQRHVWVVGDDDVVGERTLAQVLERLEQYPKIGLLTLNHSSRYADGPQRFARCFPLPTECHDPNGVELLTACLGFDDDGVGLISAHVFRTDLVCQALREWPTEANIVVVTYWAAHCAREGGMLLTADTLLECTAGKHFWSDDPVMDMRMRLSDTPELGQRLLQIGYDRRACTRLALQQITPRNARVVAAAYGRAPGTTLRVLGTFFWAVWQAGPVQAPQYLATKLMGRLARGGRPKDREQMASVFARVCKTAPAPKPIRNSVPTMP